MIIGDACCAVDSATKFHNFFYVFGWFHDARNRLQSVQVKNCHVLSQLQSVGLPHDGVLSLGPNKGFRLQAMMGNDEFPREATLEFAVSGQVYEAPLNCLIHERLKTDPSALLSQKFADRLRLAASRPKLLDIGGRNRSILDRSKLFPYADVTVVDIIPSTNVDVVGDAHELAALFAPESFDAVISVSVFEHLLMPWKVVLGINAILKVGGIGLISTHQTLGMHDEPWDFWRFSAHSWDALFNAQTGFAIQDKVQSLACFIIPMLHREDKREAEKAAGFESSAVLFQKTGDTLLSWKVSTSEIIDTTYPVSS